MKKITIVLHEMGDSDPNSCKEWLQEQIDDLNFVQNPEDGILSIESYTEEEILKK